MTLLGENVRNSKLYLAVSGVSAAGARLKDYIVMNVYFMTRPLEPARSFTGLDSAADTRILCIRRSIGNRPAA